MKTTLCCLIQNRLGALDRVLGALTYRGMIPEAMMSTTDTQSGHLQVAFTIECDSEHALEKLIKILDKQVTVLETRQITNDQPESQPLPLANIAFMTSPFTTTPQRRLIHA